MSKKMFSVVINQNAANNLLVQTYEYEGKTFAGISRGFKDKESGETKPFAKQPNFKSLETLDATIKALVDLRKHCKDNDILPEKLEAPKAKASTAAGSINVDAVKKLVASGVSLQAIATAVKMTEAELNKLLNPPKTKTPTLSDIELANLVMIDKGKEALRKLKKQAAKK